MNNNYEILRTENNHQTFTSQFKNKNELCIKKETKSINSHNTHIEKKEKSVEKKSHNFLVQNFQKKKKILSFYLLLPILQFLKSPPLTLDSPPPFWATPYQATPKKLPKQTQRSICKCQK